MSARNRQFSEQIKDGTQEADMRRGIYLGDIPIRTVERKNKKSKSPSLSQSQIEKKKKQKIEKQKQKEVVKIYNDLKSEFNQINLLEQEHKSYIIKIIKKTLKIEEETNKIIEQIGPYMIQRFLLVASQIFFRDVFLKLINIDFFYDLLGEREFNSYFLYFNQFDNFASHYDIYNKNPKNLYFDIIIEFFNKIFIKINPILNKILDQLLKKSILLDDIISFYQENKVILEPYDRFGTIKQELQDFRKLTPITNIEFRNYFKLFFQELNQMSGSNSILSEKLKIIFKDFKLPKDKRLQRTRQMQEAEREQRKQEYEIYKTKKQIEKQRYEKQQYEKTKQMRKIYAASKLEDYYSDLAEKINKQITDDSYDEPDSVYNKLRMAVEDGFKVIPEIPGEFICPVSQDIMTDPVVAEDGISYQRTELENYFKSHDGPRIRSPYTRELISKNILVPNIRLKSLIQNFKDEYNIN
jgi:hypothetical protein